MDVGQFDFTLPPDRIALRPLQPRDSARLLQLTPEGVPADLHVRDLPDCLRPGDCLVFNNSRVLPVQLSGRRGTAHIGVTLIERMESNRWWSYVKNAKRVHLGDEVDFGAGVRARADARDSAGRILWHFELADALENHLPHIGAMPLPPYIAARRAADSQDVQDYQTIFAQHDGSVAAPTAGLHFEPHLLARLENAGVSLAFVTLHVGPGTFLPVKVSDTRDHVMHSEWAQMDAATAVQLEHVRSRGGRIVAVGTTALRVLETVVQAHGRFAEHAAPTSIFITPGYVFRAIDGLMTNFHLPRSTLFMLVCALAGIARTHAAYGHAIQQGYRFYSYGDASLVWRAPQASESS